MLASRPSESFPPSNSHPSHFHPSHSHPSHPRHRSYPARVLHIPHSQTSVSPLSLGTEPSKYFTSRFMPCRWTQHARAHALFLVRACVRACVRARASARVWYLAFSRPRGPAQPARTVRRMTERIRITTCVCARAKGRASASESRLTPNMTRMAGPALPRLGRARQLTRRRRLGRIIQ